MRTRVASLVGSCLLASVASAQASLPADAGVDAASAPAPADTGPETAAPEAAPAPSDLPQGDAGGPAAQPARESSPNERIAHPQRPPPAPMPSPETARAMPPAPAAQTDELPNYTAVAVAPTPGARIALEKVPRNVQRLGLAQLRAEHTLGLHDALAAQLGAATLNDVQNNPLQPDFQFRGFTASPLLGTPEGLAVYQNGVRINEAFGDLLLWDLVPSFAIDEVELSPGANPIYGLNALGGSLILRMKNGFREPGTRVQALAGSFGRYQASAEYGRVTGDWAGYAGVSAFGEQGFRDDSRSRANNLYADLRHKTEAQEVGISATLAHTDLNGDGPAPIELLAQDRAAVYTRPDNTKNDLLMLAADLNQRLATHVGVQATLYFRHTERRTLNGDSADFAACPPSVGDALLCDDQARALRTEAGMRIAAADGYDALANTGQTQSDGYGGSLQLAVEEPLGSRPNQLVLGSSFDAAAIGFVQRVEIGRLSVERAVEGSNLFLSGPGFHTSLGADARLFGLFLTDTFTLAEPFAVNLAARFNWADLNLDDRLGGELSGDHAFARVNPTLGLTYTPLRELTLFASYGEANRAPSAAELACADPNQPCRVQNAFIADPPLKQVVSRSVELGLRGRVGARARPALEGSLAAFGSRNRDDILFVAGSRVGTGFFQNAGTTQRAGLELSLRGHAGAVFGWYASYALLRATFETSLELPGGANPSARVTQSGERVLDVRPGDRIPGLPVHAAKAGVEVSPLARLTLGLSAIAQSAQRFHGDEANQRPEVHGFIVLNAHASYRLFDELTLFADARNLFDTHYETFGVLADPSQALAHASDPRFLSPAAPFGVWAGVELSVP